MPGSWVLEMLLSLGSKQRWYQPLSRSGSVVNLKAIWQCGFKGFNKENTHFPPSGMKQVSYQMILGITKHLFV